MLHLRQQHQTSVFSIVCKVLGSESLLLPLAWPQTGFKSVQSDLSPHLYSLQVPERLDTGSPLLMRPSILRAFFLDTSFLLYGSGSGHFNKICAQKFQGINKNIMFLLYFSAILCVCKHLCGPEGNISSLPTLIPLYGLRQHLPLNVSFINLEGWLVPGTTSVQILHGFGVSELMFFLMFA